MIDGPDIARIAALLGDPARASMMTALLSNPALTAGELAREAGVTAQTASSHLAKLTAGGLLTDHRQGRHRYYALAGEDVTATLEALMGLAARTGHSRVRTGPRDAALRQARVCYDHLAGDVGVALLDGLVSRRLIARDGDELSLTAAGETLMAAIGVDTAGLARSRRPLCKACLDWSVRRSHLAGALGAGLLSRFERLGWVHREPAGRAVGLSDKGRVALREIFGVTPVAP
jgi:DNA-binding transcriptional ArsR family regulator